MKHPELFTMYATREDIDDMLELSRDFFKESNFNQKLTLDLEVYRELILEFIDDPQVASIICVDAETGFICGYFHIYCERHYTQELVGEMFQFYVKPEYRGTKAARLIIESAKKWYKEKGCARAYFDADPGFDDDGRNIKLITNLLGKFGYKASGVSLQVDLLED